MNKEKNQGRKEDWKTERMKGKEVGNKKQKRKDWHEWNERKVYLINV